MESKNKPIIAITMGDPCGIGPEIICKSLSELLNEYNFQPVILGNLEALEYAQETIKTHIQFIKIFYSNYFYFIFIRSFYRRMIAW